ncbi:MAG: pseudouridine synthase [Chthonomonas sp.]|nr:pseudouridine synthase [Chthonomonas sp.]
MKKPDRPYNKGGKKPYGSKPDGDRRSGPPKDGGSRGYSSNRGPKPDGPPKERGFRPKYDPRRDGPPKEKRTGPPGDGEKRTYPPKDRGRNDGPPKKDRPPYGKSDRSGPPKKPYGGGSSAKRLLKDVIQGDRPDRPRYSDRSTRPERRERDDGPPKERLHKYLARCGVASRRAAEIMIQEGRVELNGELVTEMGVLVDGYTDDIRVDGKRCRPEKLAYVLLNKPKGVITTLSDPRRRPTITQYLPDLGVMLRPVGRLDMESTGLIICTNDGNLADRLTHPSFGVEKEYDVIVRGEVGERALKRLRNGVYILGKWTAEAYVEVISYEKRSDTTKLRMIIHEGRNRQIRLMCDSVGHPVEALERVRIGPLKIRGLRSGEARLIGMQEVEELWGASGPLGKKEWFENRVKSVREKRPPKPREDEAPAPEKPTSVDASNSEDR